MPRTISDVQRYLGSLGYYIGPDGVDGVDGSYTQRAVAKYQGDNGLVPNGRVNRDTLKSLFPEDYKQRTPVMGNIFSGLFANLLNWQLIQSYIRNALVAFGGSFVTSGVLTNTELNTIVGALMIVIGLGFSMISGLQKKTALDVVKAVDASSNLTLIPASATANGKPHVLVTRP